MKRIVAIVTLIGLVAANGQAQTLTDADITTSIKAGEANKFKQFTSSCLAHPGDVGSLFGNALRGERTGSYDVTVFTRQDGLPIVLTKASARIGPSHPSM